MNAGDVQRINVCSELSVGDEIEAWHHGRLLHRGAVTRIIPLTELFWMTDAKNGTRRLVDLEALDVLRPALRTTDAGHRACGAGAAKTRVLVAVGATGGSGATAQAAARMPLFQEPGTAAPLRC